MAQNKAFSLGSVGAPCCCATGCTVAFRVTCSGSLQSGALVTLVPVGGGPTLSGTTNGVGEIIFTTGFSAGTYAVTVSKSGFPTYSATQPLTCGLVFNVDLCCIININVTVCSGGDAPAVGAAVRVSQGSTTIASGFVDATGNFEFPGNCSILPQTYLVTVTFPFYVTYSASSVFGFGIAVVLVPISGYICPCIGTEPCQGSVFPIPSTLTLNDGIGNVTLTYDGVATWTGCAIRTFNNICIFDTGTSTYSIGSGSFPLFFVLKCDGPGFIVDYSISANNPSNGDGIISPSSCGSVTPNFVLGSTTPGVAAVACNPFDWVGTQNPIGGCLFGVCTVPVTCNSGNSGVFGCSVYGCGTATFTVTP